MILWAGAGGSACNFQQEGEIQPAHVCILSTLEVSPGVLSESPLL